MPSDAGVLSAESDRLIAGVDEAIATGYRKFDTALVYNTEPALGRALKKNMEKGTVRREELFITSKVPSVHMSREGVQKAIKQSLENLQLDYLDLYLIHGPWTIKSSAEGNTDIFKETDYPRTKFEEVWQAMEEVVDSGRAKAIGISNFNSEQIKRVWKVARHPISNLQVECHAAFQQKKLIDFCQERKIVVTAYSPLGSPGRPDFLQQPGHTNVLEEPIVLDLAKKYNKTPAQILLRWNIQRGIAVIPKSLTPSRVRENFQIFDFQLTEEDMIAMGTLDRNIRYFQFPNSLGLHPDDPYKDVEF